MLSPSSLIHLFSETKYLTFALLFCMLLLINLFSQPDKCEHSATCGGDFVLPHSAAAATLYMEAVPSMSRDLKTSFCSVHRQKIPGVPKALCIAMACTKKPLVTQSQWRCLWIPAAV